MKISIVYPGLLLCASLASAQNILNLPPESLKPGQVKILQTKLSDYGQLGRYAAENATLPASPSGRVVFYGDSITDAWGRQKDAAPWFPGKPYVNRGISGQTSPQMLVRFRQDVIDLHPSAVILLAGTNDVAGNTGPETPEQVVGYIQSMAELAKTNRIKVIICSILPADHYIWEPTVHPAETIRQINTALKRYAAAEGLVYVDYYSALTNATGGMREGTSLDGVHPTAQGYSIMAPLAEAGIEMSLNEKPS